MARPSDCTVIFEPSCRRPTSDQRDAVVLALRQLVDPSDPAEELSLDEGLSGARVYQGQLTYASMCEERWARRRSCTTFARRIASSPSD